MSHLTIDYARNNVTDTACIQECHIMIGRIICGYIEATLFSDHAR